MKLLYCIFLTFIFTSCSNERARMIHGLSGEYAVDLDLSDSEIIESLSVDKNTHLILEENGTFHVKSTNTCLRSLRGEWTLSDDIEISYYVFTHNGKTYQTRVLALIVLCNGKKGRLVF
jgi:hypothetical protein